MAETDNHLVLWDLRPTRTGRGSKVEKVCEAASHLFESQHGPLATPRRFLPVASRIGAPAMTTRGLYHGGLQEIAYFLDRCASHKFFKFIPDQLFGVGAPCASWAPLLHRGACAGDYSPVPHHHDPNENAARFSHFGLWWWWCVKVVMNKAMSKSVPICGCESGVVCTFFLVGF